MPTTPLSEASKTSRNSKKTSEAGVAGRPFERVAHEEEPEMHPVDAAVERRLPARAVRRRIKRHTRDVVAALGGQHQLWLSLEEAINELKSNREEEYFNVGFEHGFAAGRSVALNIPIKVRALAARLRDCAIQNGGHEHALSALLAAAFALALPTPIPSQVGIRRAERSLRDRKLGLNKPIE